ncbi:MAG: cyclodeaminase/cyclohydrolase family protein [Anaerolineales bacterium]
MAANTKAFLRVLDSSENTTGGGTASAVAGAMAAALVAMVARLSIGKQDLEDEDFYREIIKEAESLSTELMDGGSEDSEAYSAIRESFRLPKETEEQKNLRTEAIEDAMIHAARVPMLNAKHCQRILKLAGRLKGRSNPNAASDLECGEHLARAGMLGCVANVKINLPGIKDEERKAGIIREVEELTKTKRQPYEKSAAL